MDFREVCDIFGGSIFYEDLRGNFVEIEELISSRYPHEEGDYYSEQFAARTLLESIVRFLKGDFWFGVQGLGSMTEGWNGDRFAFRAYSYLLFHLSLRCNPPLFRNKPYQSGPISFILAHEFDDDTRAVTYASNLQRLMKHATPLDVLEAHVFHNLWSLSYYGIDQALLKNPGFPDFCRKRTARRPVVPDNALEGFYDEIKTVLPKAREANMPHVEAYLNRLLYELDRAQGLEGAVNTLNNVEVIYQNHNDKIGVAVCELLKGDAACSSPWSTPVTLCLPLIQSWDIGPCDVTEGLLPSFIDKRADIEDFRYEHILVEGEKDQKPTVEDVADGPGIVPSILRQIKLMISQLILMSHPKEAASNH